MLLLSTNIVLTFLSANIVIFFSTNIVIYGAQTITSLCSREHKLGIFVLPGARKSIVCAPGSTKTAYLCSREHIQQSFVTNKQHLCSWKHEQAMLVHTGTQIDKICAPRSTNSLALPGA